MNLPSKQKQTHRRRDQTCGGESPQTEEPGGLQSMDPKELNMTKDLSIRLLGHSVTLAKLLSFSLPETLHL